MPAGLEVADVLRRHGEAYRRTHDAHLGRVERRVMSAIELCRTAAFGRPYGSLHRLRLGALRLQ